ncbi:MAG TPA: VWA domain-containing protein, partial [Phycisphaerae bacterium]|nr:VWA domain-containing protein [Phycisphaerae bacterium]
MTVAEGQTVMGPRKRREPKLFYAEVNLDEPGLFLILISPAVEIDADRRVPRDVAFVLDTSGSMKGEKIEQAKKALAFCIGKLAAADRFAIVQFSTIAQAFGEEGRWTR